MDVMEPKEIFELIVKADERLKYATGDKQATRVEQARAFLERARTEARATGNDALAEQAEQRLIDLDRINPS
jgi:hypothetical protein